MSLPFSCSQVHQWISKCFIAWRNNWTLNSSTQHSWYSHRSYQVCNPHMQATYYLTGILGQIWWCLVPIYQICRTVHRFCKVIPHNFGSLPSSSLSLNNWKWVCPSTPITTIVLNWICGYLLGSNPFNFCSKLGEGFVLIFCMPIHGRGKACGNSDHSVCLKLCHTRKNNSHMVPSQVLYISLADAVKL